MLYFRVPLPFCCVVLLLSSTYSMSPSPTISLPSIMLCPFHIHPLSLNVHFIYTTYSPHDSLLLNTPCTLLHFFLPPYVLCPPTYCTLNPRLTPPRTRTACLHAYTYRLILSLLSTLTRLGLKPVIFLLNNNGYLIERLLCNEQDIAYNDLAPWRYAELPHAFGCDNWFTAAVRTVQEFDQALKTASNSNRAAYIEVITDTYAASDAATKMHEFRVMLYNK